MHWWNIIAWLGLIAKTKHFSGTKLTAYCFPFIVPKTIRGPFRLGLPVRAIDSSCRAKFSVDFLLLIIFATKLTINLLLICFFPNMSHINMHLHLVTVLRERATSFWHRYFVPFFESPLLINGVFSRQCGGALLLSIVDAGTQSTDSRLEFERSESSLVMTGTCNPNSGGISNSKDVRSTFIHMLKTSNRKACWTFQN